MTRGLPAAWLGAVLILGTLGTSQPQVAPIDPAERWKGGGAEAPVQSAPQAPGRSPGPLAGATACTGRAIAPGSDIQAAIDAGPAGSTFCLEPGTHRITDPIVPKSGDRLIGEPGARLNGSKVIRRWKRRRGYWLARGQRTGPSIECLSGVPCDEVLYRTSIYADDVFYDDVPLTRVMSRRRLREKTRSPSKARFSFNYRANRIWLNIAPRRHRLEVAVAEGLIEGSSEIHNVTVEGLVLEKAAGFGVSTNNGTGWIIRNNEIRLNHTQGVRAWGRAQVISNHVHNNGQYGVAASDGPGILVEGNEIDHNNRALYRISSGFWDSGGTKFVRTSGLVIRRNNVHDNYGDGLWVDIDNSDVTIEGNTITENERFGIFYEISHRGTILNNTLAGNDEDAIRITSADEVEVIGSSISVAAGDPQGAGIRLEQDDREAAGYVLRDVHVHDNLIKMCRGTTGAVTSYGGNDIFLTRNNRFNRNVYQVGTSSTRWWEWSNSLLTWSEWRAQGLDPSGIVQEVSC